MVTDLIAGKIRKYTIYMIFSTLLALSNTVTVDNKKRGGGFSPVPQKEKKMKYYLKLLVHCFNVCIEVKKYFQNTVYPLKPIRFFYGEFLRILNNDKYYLCSLMYGERKNIDWDFRTWSVIETVKSWENPNI
jgi:hypothetical protein